MKKLIKKGLSVFFVILFSFIVLLNITVLTDSTNKDKFLGLDFLSSIAFAGGEEVYYVCPPGMAAHHRTVAKEKYCKDTRGMYYQCGWDYDCVFSQNSCCMIF